LHYAFIDLGTPKTQFLVALDTGSDLLWIPCECQQCAPLSAPSSIPVTVIYLILFRPLRLLQDFSFSSSPRRMNRKKFLCSCFLFRIYNKFSKIAIKNAVTGIPLRNLLNIESLRNLLWYVLVCRSAHAISFPECVVVVVVVVQSHLAEYSPTSSSTSKPVSCSDALCDSAVSDGQCTAKTDQCGYQINYVSANTSTTGFLFSDQMWFASESGSRVISTAVTFG
jgi:hypothetical protein